MSPSEDLSLSLFSQNDETKNENKEVKTRAFVQAQRSTIQFQVSVVIKMMVRRRSLLLNTSVCCVQCEHSAVRHGQPFDVEAVLVSRQKVGS